MREEIYRVAYDEARSELSDILTKFEQLRIRKDKVEKVVEALKPLLSGIDVPVHANVSERTSAPTERQPVAVAGSPIPYPVQQAVESSDPFARRYDSAATTARDVKEYSRLFNSTLTR